MPMLYWRGDNGQLYPHSTLDVPAGHRDGDPVEGFLRYRVPDVVTFSAANLCVEDGSILEALLATKQAESLDT